MILKLNMYILMNKKTPKFHFKKRSYNRNYYEFVFYIYTTNHFNMILSTSIKLFFCGLLTLICSFPTHAQFILAGAHGSAGYHHDYSPHAPLHAPLTMNIIQDSIGLDMNNNGTDDFRLIGTIPIPA